MKTLYLESPVMDVRYYVDKFGPDEDDYQKLDWIINNINDHNEIILLKKSIEPVINNNTLFGHAYQKPFGYAGDFLLIEKMYHSHISIDTKYVKWDKYYNYLEAAKAVRNRKYFFTNTIKKKSKYTSQPLKVLILGSGPATDVYECLNNNLKLNISFDLLDIDYRAIIFAKNKLMKYINHVNFIQQNVLRFFTQKKYDIIWSAGLFDYLKDKYFINLINRFTQNLKPNGELIIGNFSNDNPTKKVMETITEWYLIHRSKKQLIQLALDAGVEFNKITVEQEPLGINLFLIIKNHNFLP